MATTTSPRRGFLKAAGISIALPSLASNTRASAVDAKRQLPSPPKRMVCVGNEFGMYPGAFWPAIDKTHSDASAKLSPLLTPLEKHRRNFTLFSHLDHGLKGGHFAVHTFLTGVKAVDAGGMPDGGISLDQRAAEHVGSQTRFPSLTVGSESGLHGGCRMSWTRTGTRVPPIQGPRELFRMLFVDTNKDAKTKAFDRIDLQGSILDAVLGDANSLSRRLNPRDKDKLDEYLSSVREVELRLELDRRWQKVAKPKATIDEPSDQGLTHDLPKIYDLIALALQTDSTRVATIEVGGSFAASDLGIKKGYHGLSHHGQVQQNIDLLVQIERYQVEQFARFLDRLSSIREPESDGTLLDHTMALFGSGMGNANSHTNNDLPVVLAGGGFKHQTLLEMPSEKNRRRPLSNLFLTMLQQFGVETESFATSTGTLTGFETV
ncbi:hypothetical protein Poly51_56260 [Rubripirellula tenax]|uniref:Secreted protein containing DUF1552 n=1 Tax=Rubripirellula tenax TaxID=2528015 RepID=A0A5C6EBX6_9BACT|nr:DUF1552 domain-containing protein [Rubripirellula tenax]TWU46230.1 hypothetical protein Poly51_56260 [Rubripirellula tenax]